MFRHFITSAFLVAFAAAVGGCGDTWEGAKQDTGENLEATGEALDKAGKKVKD